MLAYLKKIMCRKNDQKKHFLPACQTIMHVGANTGQERDQYGACNLNVIWVEPINEVFKKLQDNISGYPGQFAVQALLADVAGKEMTLNISNNCGQSSSIFEIKYHKDIWPEVYFCESRKFVTRTVDCIAAEYDFKFDAIVLDTQGSELMVLKGAQKTLNQVSFVKLEVADFEAYEGAPQLNDYIEFFRVRGMKIFSREEFARHPNKGRYYDIVFTRGA